MEEDNCDTATISSISSLKTEDIAALDKLFEKAKKSRRAECVDESTESNQAHQVQI